MGNAVHKTPVSRWQHEHTFGQDRAKVGERRTLIVIAITAITMVVEIAAGIAFGSMALLADGLHMGSHTAALSITVIAYVYTRRHANDSRFCFGTGKVNALGAFASAILLALFALLMVWESIDRFFNPVDILFNQAILVAVLGLLVNGASVLILGVHNHNHDHHHSHSHHHHEHSHGQADHNLRAAYLHVLADALTSLLAIFALLAGKYFGLMWMDPLMGIIGAILVARWSWGLLRDTSGVLLDRQVPAKLQEKVQHAIESSDDNRIADLHLWSIGPDILAAVITVVTREPKSPDHYKTLLPQNLGIVHANIEVYQHKSKSHEGAA